MNPESPDIDRRLHASLRLKAARWLHGHLDEKGRAKPLTTASLAAMRELVANDITKNRLEDIEQMRTPTPPRSMELEQIERALALPSGWFTVGASAPAPLEQPNGAPSSSKGEEGSGGEGPPDRFSGSGTRITRGDRAREAEDA